MTLILKDDNGKNLPQDTQDRVNNFIDNLKNISWFNPSEDLKKADVDKQVKFTLECFGVKAGIEYRKLETETDFASARASAWASAWDSAWASAWASAWDSAWDSAWVSSLDSALASARDSARDSAMDSAWVSSLDSAWASARASAEWLLLDNTDFKQKYPNGAFRQLFVLWSMGLYPVGVLKNGNFVIYADPKAKDLFIKEPREVELPEELEINGIMYIKK